MRPAPPRLMRLLLAVLLPKRLRADIVADMDAIWRARAAHDRWLADRWYRQHVRASLAGAARARFTLPRHRPLPINPRTPHTGGSLVRNSIKDVAYVGRWARLNPGFTAVVLATLALGIGANTAMFSVVYGVLFSPLPYPGGDRIVRFFNTNEPEHQSRQSLSVVELVEYLDNQDMFEAMAGMNIYPVTLTGGEEPVRVRASVVTAGFFESFATPARLGRTFNAEEIAPGGDPVVVISDGFWRRAFGGREDVIGSDLGVDGRLRRIVGVMPPDFDYYPGTEVWLPFVLDRAMLEPDQVLSHNLVAVARLRPGADLARTQAAADRLVEGVIEQYPQHDGYHAALLVPLSTWFTGSVRPMLLMLLGAVAFMLLIVCANIAALMLTRAEGRRREIAIRAALGAGRGRLVRQLMTESLALAGAGGLLGVLVAYLVSDVVAAQLASGLPRSQAVGMSWPVLAFSFGVSMLTGVLFGFAPTLQVSAQRLSDVLRSSGRTATGAGRQRARGFLVAGEVALVVALLMGTALIGRTFLNLMSVEPGVEAEGVLTFDVELPEAVYPTHADVVRTFETMGERLERLPGVTSVGAVSWLPFADFPSQWGIEIDGVVVPEELELPDYTLVSGDYFDTVGLGIEAGRGFGPDEHATAAIVTASAARMYWPDREPLGQRIRLQGGDAWRTIVGVVSDYKNRGLSAAPRQGVYFPHSPLNFGREWYPRRMSFTVAASSDPMTIVPAVREVVWSIDGNLPLGRLQPFTEVLEQVVAGTWVTTVLLVCFAALGLILAAVGIHGVVAQSVLAGQREIGIRLALGARAQRVLREVVTRSMIRIGAGLAVGLVLGYWLTRSLMSTMLFGVSAADPVAWLVVVVVLGVVGLVATLLPARRALRVDPVVILRAD